MTDAYKSPATINGATKERSYAATAYHVPASGLTNPDLVTGSLMKFILLGKADNSVVANGVHFLRNGEETIEKARKEAILAAVVFQPPKILDLSGIGAASILHD